MKNSKNYLHILKIFLFTILFFIIIIYAGYKLSDWYFGPTLKINFPIDGQIVTDDLFYVTGNIQNVKNITINDREINIDQHGNFKIELIAHSPLTIITVNAVDRYGKSLHKVLKVVKNP